MLSTFDLEEHPSKNLGETDFHDTTLLAPGAPISMSPPAPPSFLPIVASHCVTRQPLSNGSAECGPLALEVGRDRVFEAVSGEEHWGERWAKTVGACERWGERTPKTVDAPQEGSSEQAEIAA